MKRLLMTAACATLVGIVQAAENTDLPCHLRIQVEYIEAAHVTITEVLQSDVADSGPKIHARMRALVKEKKARIMETSIVTARPGQKATVESIQEYIYPSDYDPGDGLGGTPPPPQFKPNWLIRPETPVCFETRNVGVTLEIEPNLGANNQIIDLRFAPEIVDRLRLETWVEHRDQWGDASLRRPIFESLRISTGITLLRGQFGFVGLLSPTKADGGLHPERRIMLFVRADVVYIEDPGKQ